MMTIGVPLLFRNVIDTVLRLHLRQQLTMAGAMVLPLRTLTVGTRELRHHHPLQATRDMTGDLLSAMARPSLIRSFLLPVVVLVLLLLEEIMIAPLLPGKHLLIEL
jgi:hypothetical protein